MENGKFCLKGLGSQRKARCDRTYANCKSTRRQIA